MSNGMTDIELRYMKAYLRWRLKFRNTEPRVPNDSFVGLTPKRAQQIRIFANTILLEPK